MTPTPEGVKRLAYTTDEAAQALGTSRQFIYNEMSRGKLRTVLLGRCRRILVDDLNAYMETARSNGTS